MGTSSKPSRGVPVNLFELASFTFETSTKETNCYATRNTRSGKRIAPRLHHEDHHLQHGRNLG